MYSLSYLSVIGLLEQNGALIWPVPESHILILSENADTMQSVLKTPS